ncbi:hypothetical protein CVT26_004201 [Gymnopilus dilepis]|uniref:Uncharacterized protein n=1 Tax=Gymnopilus dilepis TaxID=231916 RepID=A0A409WTX2_9AGAR|nr:hypothetical protein CVT26_004201 [Gymnopilus dilepis]
MLAVEHILNPGEKTQQVFDHIVNMRHLGQEADASATRPRVVYLRDSSTIYPSAQIFLPYLLAAVRNRRTSKGPENPNTCETPIRPTILVFGWSFDLQDPLKSVNNLQFSWKVGVSAEESVNMEDTLAGKQKRVVLGA